MLTSITLKNYTTFITETTFDFTATNSKILDETNVGDNRVLKGSLFVGENASGKTQTLKALKILLDLLFGNEEIYLGSLSSLYTNSEKFSFSYDFKVDENEIKYFIEFDGFIIKKEKLYVNDKLIINRLNNNGEIRINDEVKDVNDINDNLLLLKLEYYNTRFNNDELLNKWFDFLKNSIYVETFLSKKRVKSYNPSKADFQIIEKYAEKNISSKLNDFIEKIGYNSEIVFDNKRSEYEKIYLKKRGTSKTIPLYFESTGNKSFMNLILPFIYACENDCMIIIDEFSSGLHNELEESLIRYFFNNSHNSQIFFTSHSTNLLDTSILRPDQIYSFSFDPKKGTQIKRFSDENPRESQNLEKMYLNGVFDGKPNYNKEFKN